MSILFAWFWTKCWNQADALVCQSQDSLSSLYNVSVTSTPLALVPVCMKIAVLAGCKGLEAGADTGEARRLRSTVRPREKRLAPTLHPTNFSIMWNHRSFPSTLPPFQTEEISAVTTQWETGSKIPQERVREAYYCRQVKTWELQFWLFSCLNIIPQICCTHLVSRSPFKTLWKSRMAAVSAQPVRNGPGVVQVVPWPSPAQAGILQDMEIRKGKQRS